MNPTSSKQVASPKKVRRRVMCRNYGACLDKALREGWPGFSCSECSGYVMEDPDSSPYWMVQGERCGRILKRIFIDKAPRCGRSWRFRTRTWEER